MTGLVDGHTTGSAGVIAEVKPATYDGQKFVAIVIDGEIQAMMSPPLAIAYAQSMMRVALWASDPPQGQPNKN